MVPANSNCTMKGDLALGGNGLKMLFGCRGTYPCDVGIADRIKCWFFFGT